VLLSIHGQQLGRRVHGNPRTLSIAWHGEGRQITKCAGPVAGVEQVSVALSQECLAPKARACSLAPAPPDDISHLPPLLKGLVGDTQRAQCCKVGLLFARGSIVLLQEQGNKITIHQDKFENKYLQNLLSQESCYFFIL
jgi:hypothetical protein